MAAQVFKVECLIDIQPGNLFYGYIANLKARPVILPNFMINDSASNAPKSVIHARDDASHMLGDVSPITTPWDRFNSDLSIN